MSTEISLEPELEIFLSIIADEKNVTLSEYCRHVLDVGLDAIYQKNRRNWKNIKYIIF